MIETLPTTPTMGRDPKAEPPAKSGFSLWDDDGFGFGDILDAVNPLQHLPVIGTLYREFVDDDIGVVSKLAGGALFAGIPGLIGSAVDAAFEAVAGKDIGATAMAFLTGDDDGQAETVLASGEAGKSAAQGAAGFGSALDLALLAGSDRRDAGQEDRRDAGQNFALRFDRETGAYRHGHRLGLQDGPSFRITA